MLGTKTLWHGPWSSLLRNINHPAPINQQESKRLLDALTTSFRRSLDKEHDSPPASSSAAAASSAHDALYIPTDRHVRSILSNPLFSYDPTKTSAKPSGPSDPLAVFDRAVAKGLMTPDRAAGIIGAQRSVARKLSDTSVPRTDIALRVVQWLRSSGMERDLSFIPHRRLLSHLLPVMFEEGLEEIAWAWLDRWLRGEGLVLPLGERIDHAAYLLLLIMHARTAPFSSLDRGYVAMVRADDMFSHLKDFKYAAPHSWRFLARSTTIDSLARPQPSEALFDSFVAVSNHFVPRIFHVLHRAHLYLYHPTQPDATLAVEYLQSDHCVHLQERVKLQLQTGSQGPPSPSTLNIVLKKLVAMTADTARHLRQNGRYSDAEWAQGLLQLFRSIQPGHFVQYPATLAT